MYFGFSQNKTGYHDIIEILLEKGCYTPPPSPLLWGLLPMAVMGRMCRNKWSLY